MFTSSMEKRAYLKYIKYGTKINMIITGKYSGSLIDTPVNGEYIEHDDNWVKVRPKFKSNIVNYKFDEIHSIGSGWR